MYQHSKIVLAFPLQYAFLEQFQFSHVTLFLVQTVYALLPARPVTSYNMSQIDVTFLFSVLLWTRPELFYNMYNLWGIMNTKYILGVTKKPQRVGQAVCDLAFNASKLSNDGLF